MRRRVATSMALLLALWAHALPVAAKPPAPDAARSEDDVRLELGAGTSVPLDMGVLAVAEFPYRILGELEVGWMPGPYVDVVNGLATGFGWYDDVTADLIASALESSLLLRPSLGWRPFPKLGFEFSAGYTFAALGGGLGPVEAIEAVTQEDLSREQRREMPLSSQLHAFHLALAWRLDLAKHLALRARLEYLQVFASSSSIDQRARTALGRAVLSSAEQKLDAYLAGIYTSYVKAVGLGVYCTWVF